jgi:hypothetical protein
MISYLANLSFYATTPDSRLDTKDERSNLSLMYWEIALDYTGNSPSLNLGNGKFIATSDIGGSVTTDLLTEAYNHRLDAIDMAIYSPMTIANRPSQEFLALKVNVPEPGTIGMLLMGLLGLVAYRRKHA